MNLLIIGKDNNLCVQPATLDTLPSPKEGLASAASKILLLISCLCVWREGESKILTFEWCLRLSPENFRSYLLFLSLRWRVWILILVARSLSNLWINSLRIPRNLLRRFKIQTWIVSYHSRSSESIINTNLLEHTFMARIFWYHSYQLHNISFLKTFHLHSLFPKELIQIIEVF